MKVLVYGWYFQGNLGDDLFIDAFKTIFPEIDFTFADSISLQKVKGYDALFIGGGSFLYDAPRITDEALAFIKKMKVFYIGVGVESGINPVHLELMSIAQLIATRSASQVERLKKINKNVWLIPDLVYALQKVVKPTKRFENSILVLPNMAVQPKVNDPHWKHAAWGYFKSEFCQFLDWAVEAKYTIHFAAMCMARKEDDRWAATEIVAHMQNRSNSFLRVAQPENFRDMTSMMSRHSVTITQRFHGIVMAELTKSPYISIHHHDKLKKNSSFNGQFVPYYGFNKNDLINSMDLALKMKYENVLPIESNIFEALHDEVIKKI